MNEKERLEELFVLHSDDSEEAQGLIHLIGPAVERIADKVESPQAMRMAWTLLERELTSAMVEFAGRVLETGREMDALRTTTTEATAN